jgi:hypothetical protein
VRELVAALYARRVRRQSVQWWFQASDGAPSDYCAGRKSNCCPTTQYPLGAVWWASIAAQLAHLTSGEHLYSGDECKALHEEHQRTARKPAFGAGHGSSSASYTQRDGLHRNSLPFNVPRCTSNGDKWSVRQLKQYLDHYDVSHADLREKSELEARVREHMAASKGDQHPGSAGTSKAARPKAAPRRAASYTGYMHTAAGPDDGGVRHHPRRRNGTDGAKRNETKRGGAPTDSGGFRMPTDDSSSGRRAGWRRRGDGRGGTGGAGAGGGCRGSGGGGAPRRHMAANDERWAKRVLGLRAGANVSCMPLQEVRKAYHLQARRWHPDKHAHKSLHDVKRATAVFQQVSQAFSMLSAQAKSD